MELQNLQGEKSIVLCLLLFLPSHFLYVMFFSDAKDHSLLPEDWAVLDHQGAVVVLVSMRVG